MRDLITRARAAYRRSEQRPAFDAISLAYSQRCDCETYPLCPDTTDRERAYIAADMAETSEGLRRINDAVALSVLRWRRSLAVLEQLAERFERIAQRSNDTSYKEAAKSLRNAIAAMREGSPR